MIVLHIYISLQRSINIPNVTKHNAEGLCYIPMRKYKDYESFSLKTSGQVHIEYHKWKTFNE